MSKVTIKDIANQLNLSPSTISRAITDKADVNPATRKLILDKVAELNYIPNVISRSLRSRRSFSIGVIVPEFRNSFFAEILAGINNVLRAHNYHSIICQSDESPDNERSNVEFLESCLVDGFIVSSTHDTRNGDFYQNLIDCGIPVIFFNRICTNVTAPKVVIDDRKWAYFATEHLIKQGCRRIAHLIGPGNLFVSEQRKEGYLAALRDYGIPVDPSLFFPCGITLEDGMWGARKILSMEERPDGLFASSDPSAIGAMKILSKAGVRIPQDMAVVGFSESNLATIYEPNLTSVEQPTFELGASAARLLLEWISSKQMPRNLEIKLDAQLNIRESSLFSAKG